jgi:dienelactone hydrolase
MGGGHWALTFCAAISLQATVAWAGSQSYVSEKIPIRLSNQRSLQAELRIPILKIKTKPLPVFLVFGGFESAGQVLDLLAPEFPVALASFDYPFEGSREMRFPDSLRALPQAKHLFPDTVQGIRELAASLKGRTEIDPRKIIVVGASFGSPFVLAAAADNPDIAGVVIVHGFGNIPETAENVLMKNWRTRFGIFARPLAWLLSRSLWMYLDLSPPEEFARRLDQHQQVLMITAARDSFVPAEATDSLWGALTDSTARLERQDLPGDHLMPGSNALIKQLMGRIQEWLQVLR